MATTTFYPDPDVESTSVDGYAEHLYGAGSGQTWATIVAAAGTAATDDRSTNSIAASALADTGDGNWREIIRGIFLFDTSAITDTDSIDSATFSIYVPSVTDVADQLIGVVASAPASNTALVGGDYDSLGTTRFATDIDVTSLSTSAYNDFALNASGLAAITTTGVTKLGTRLSGDIDDTTPTWSSGVEPRVNCYCAEATDTTSDPKLVVVHSAAAGSPVLDSSAMIY